MNAVNDAGMKHGTHIIYSPINAAWFVMWHTQILKICTTKADALDYQRYLLHNTGKE